jgi:DNA-binding NarL/FixJ family response regulator
MQLESLLADALDDLLEMARLSTIESWCMSAHAHASGAPVFLLARAEVALRYGRLAEAQAHAEAAAAQPSAIRVRALLTAGRAAHVASHDMEALELFRRAEATATDESLRREAQWGQAMCSADLEMPDALSLFEELATGVGLHDPREAVRAAGHYFVANVIAGRVDLSRADRAAQLLPAVDDPLVESSFLSVYSSGLAAAARYEDARNAATSLLAIARRCRLDFALPYAYYSIGIAEAGFRNWDVAERTLNDGLVEARKALNAHGEQGCLAALVRTLAQRRRFDAALTLAGQYASRPPAQVPASSRVECVATHALVLAAAHELEEATSVIDSVRGLSRSAEAVAFSAAVDAIVSVKRHQSDGIDRVVHFGEQAFVVGALDVLVTVYRAVPEMLSILLRGSTSAHVQELIRRVGDADLAGAIGCPIPYETDMTALLTPRECEVHELLRHGLTNREIARLLVITEATAKRHVQHIFDKLGVRSRRTIAMQAVLESGPQATSAIDETSAGVES